VSKDLQFRNSAISQSRNSPRNFKAPGRVNLIGEHTDYNDGFVMPVAIDFSTWVTIVPLAERKLEILSENFGEQVEFDLDSIDSVPRGHWSDYPLGVAVMFKRAGHQLRGARLTIRGDVPLGSGLSSSASLEVATACAMSANSDLSIDRTELAKLCQRAENEFVGARVGIMDQFASCYGQAGKALLLDCRSLEFKLLPISEDVQMVVCNTMVKHKLASSAYNERRAQCEAGVKHFATKLSDVKALRDVTADQLEQYGGALPEVIYRRCRHIISENGRVLEAAEALAQSDLNRFGQLMNESHQSLRDDFEVSCRELDLMVDIARKVDGVYGARMTGGGFGGCTVNFVDAGQVEPFKRTVTQGYEQETKLKPEIYVCNAANGAEEVGRELRDCENAELRNLFDCD
jgi:galactokinase